MKRIKIILLAISFLLAVSGLVLGIVGIQDAQQDARSYSQWANPTSNLNSLIVCTDIAFENGTLNQTEYELIQSKLDALRKTLIGQGITSENTISKQQQLLRDSQQFVDSCVDNYRGLDMENVDSVDDYFYPSSQSFSNLILSIILFSVSILVSIGAAMIKRNAILPEAVRLLIGEDHEDDWFGRMIRAHKRNQQPELENLVLRMLDNLRRDYGLEMVGEVGERKAFDPEIYTSTTSMQKGEIGRISLPGWKINNNILRKPVITFVDED